MSWQREGFGSITPYLIVEDVDELMEFLEEAFDADVLTRRDRPDGTVIQAEVQIGDSRLIIGEPTDELGPVPGAFYLYVADCDETFGRALDAGASIFMEPANTPHTGERCGGITDPAGNLWWIATHLEVVDEEAEYRRIEELTAAAEGPEDVD